MAEYNVFYLCLNKEPRELKIGNGATLTQVIEQIKQKEGEGGIVQLFTDRIALFETVKTQNWTLEKFGVKPRKTIFVHVLPFSCQEKRYDADTKHHTALQNSKFWKAPVEQTELAQSIFLCSLSALHSMHSQQILNLTSFLHSARLVLRFSPAVLALEHFFAGGMLMNFEKHVISSACYYFFRALLPLSISDDSVFQYSPICWGSVISATSELSAEAKFHSLNLKNDNQYIKEAVCVGEGADVWDKTYLLSVSANERKQKIGMNFNPSQLNSVYDVDALIEVLSESGISNYSIWKGETNIFDFDEVKRWSSDNLKKATEYLQNSAPLKNLTFISKKDIKKSNTRFLTIDSDDRCCFVYGSSKGRDFSSLNVFSPFSEDTKNLHNLLSDNKFVQLNLSISLCGDIRPIKEIGVVVIDFSGSMTAKDTNDMTRLEAAKSYFNAFIDRTISYSSPHAMGVVCFAQKFFTINISRDLDSISDQIGKVQSSNSMGSSETNLFGAIHEAGKMILAFAEKNEKSLDKKYFKRIFALTDGEDNRKALPVHELATFLQKKDIILDSIMVSSQENADLRALTHSTGGWCFKNDKKENLLSLFERETVLHVGDRPNRPILSPVIDLTSFRKYTDINLYPYASNFDKPIPLDIQKKSISTSKCIPPTSHQSRMKRIVSEFKTLKEKPLDLFKIYLNEDDLTFWKIIFTGPSGTPYVGGTWLLYLSFPDNYPSSPPEARFITPIYHCNINNDGKICHEVLVDKWSFHTTVKEILEYISDMISDPNADDALDSVKGMLYKTDKEQYNQQVKSWVTQHASLKLTELKSKYNLVD